MKINVPTISTPLYDLLGSRIGEIEAAVGVLDNTVSIQNLGATNIFLENVKAATPETGYKIVSGAGADVKLTSIKLLNIVSDGVDNNDVRIVIT